MIKKIVASSWGKNIGIRLPKSMVEELNITDGTELTCELRNGKIVIYPADKKFTKADHVHEAMDILASVYPKK